MPDVLLIIIVSIASLFKTLSFYFWHDDYAIFYAVQNGVCEFNWPYTRYCEIFGFLYKFFGLNEFGYFFLGLVLGISFYILFYKFVKVMLDRKAALITTLILSTSYFGADNFSFAFGAITTYIVLIPLFVSFILLLKKRTIPGLIFFFLSLSIFPVRSSAFIFVGIIFAILYLRKIYKGKMLFLLIFLMSLSFVKVFIYDPWIEMGNALQIIRRAASPTITLEFLFKRVSFFLETIGTFIFNDFIASIFSVKLSVAKWLRHIFGLLIILLPIFYLKVKKAKAPAWNIVIFSLIWIAAQYTPQGLVTEWRLEATDRYMIFPFLGFLFLLGFFIKDMFYKKKFFTPLLVVLIVLLIAASNTFFAKPMQLAGNRRDFYKSLRKEIKELPTGSVLYFDSPKGEIERNLGDFMRVGFYPSEASLATELGVKIKDIKIVSDSRVISRILEDNLDTGKLFTFYYDGTRLSNTTLISRELLSKNNEDLVHKLTEKGLIPPLAKTVLPQNINLEIDAKFKSTLFKSGTCDICSYFDFLRLSNDVKRQAQTSSSDSGEDTHPKSMIDLDAGTYWLSSLKWAEGVKPILTFDFKNPNTLEGLILYYPVNYRKPTNIKLLVNGKETSYSKVDVPKLLATKIVFTPVLTNKIEIVILLTSSDRPSINEVEFIIPGFKDINLEVLTQVRSKPYLFVKTQSELNSLAAYARSGLEACLEWEAKGYGKGSVPFLLKIDGFQNRYNFDLPSTGGINPTFKIGCTDVPISFGQ